MAGIVDLAEAKAQLNITSTDLDNELQGYVDAVTAVVERHRGEVVAPRSVTEYQTARNASQLVLDARPAVELTSITTVASAMAWDVSRLHLDGARGIVTVLSGPRLNGYLKVVYQAGYEQIPADYREAALIIVQHLWDTKRGADGPPRVGGMDDSVTIPGLGYAIPNRALELLGPTVSAAG